MTITAITVARREDKNSHRRPISGTPGCRLQTDPRKFPPARPGEERPFALAPVLVLIALGGRCSDGAIGSIEAGPMGMLGLHLQDWFGLSRSAAHRRTWRWHRAGLTEREADWLAVSLGHHPSFLWTTWWRLAFRGEEAV